MIGLPVRNSKHRSPLFVLAAAACTYPIRIEASYQGLSALPPSRCFGSLGNVLEDFGDYFFGGGVGGEVGGCAGGFLAVCAADEDGEGFGAGGLF